MEDRRIVRFVKFHGYLFLAVALFLVFQELWTVTLLTFDFSSQSWTAGLDVALRGHPIVRWIFVLAWLAALAFMFGGMKWEDGMYLQPAKYAFLVEVFALLLRDLLFTIEGDPEGRIIYNLRYLFLLAVIVVYVMYSFYALRTLFGMDRRRNLGLKTIDSRLAIVNMWKV